MALRHQWRFLFLCGVLLFVLAYSLPMLARKPAYWYDEAINVELARNFADFGRLDLVVAPDMFSGAGATVGSTGYPVTVPLAGFFKLFGSGLTQARLYMLLWMSACIIVFFFIARTLWGSLASYGGTLLIATFAPFYGNGRSVMGEIPGFLFFLLSFYFLEKGKWWQSGVFLGLSVVSKPSVFVSLIPAYAFVVLFSNHLWKERVLHLAKLGASSFLALIPWFILYADELMRGGLAENIVAHFRNPYAEAGLSVSANIARTVPSLFTATTLLYMWALLLIVALTLFLCRALWARYRNLFIMCAVYVPLILLQYVKSAGYLRYLIALELLAFVLFLLMFPFFLRSITERGFFSSVSWVAQQWTPAVIIGVMVIAQAIHLFWFADIFYSEKTERTLAYLNEHYPAAVIGVMNAPQVGSLLPAGRKYQYFSTYGLWRFGTNPLLLPPDRLPDMIVFDTGNDSLSEYESHILGARYERETAFSDGFPLYRRR